MACNPRSGKGSTKVLRNRALTEAKLLQILTEAVSDNSSRTQCEGLSGSNGQVGLVSESLNELFDGMGDGLADEAGRAKAVHCDVVYIHPQIAAYRRVSRDDMVDRTN